MAEGEFKKEQMKEAFAYAKKHGWATLLKDDGTKSATLSCPMFEPRDEWEVEQVMTKKWDEFEEEIIKLKERMENGV